MNMHETNWLPGILVLAMGGLAALLFVLFGRKGGPVAAVATGSATSDDLDTRYQALLAQL